jgi:transposase InsO family protein
MEETTMPWKETGPMLEIEKLIRDYITGFYTIVELSERYNVSRKTAHKWLDRFMQEGLNGIKKLSSAPHNHPNQTPEEIVKLIIAEKHEHKSWGPKKLIPLLERKHPDLQFPSVSTAGDWLNKNGLVVKRKRKRTVEPYTQPFIDCVEPNDVWSIDYKGQFKTMDGKYCYPLTISDNCSRYLLTCKSMLGTYYHETRQWINWSFHEYGMPEAIRSDNGVPFSSTSIAGLSRLSIEWIKLGIRPERIDKGRPDQNGRHERMHKTLKAETTKPPCANAYLQQHVFDRFLKEYNSVRPHESLGQRTPESVYKNSDRRYPSRIPEPDYSACSEVRKVKLHGEISFNARCWFLSELLYGEYLGLNEIDDGIWEVRLYAHLIAYLDLEKQKVITLESWERQNNLSINTPFNKKSVT